MQTDKEIFAIKKRKALKSTALRIYAEALHLKKRTAKADWFGVFICTTKIRVWLHDLDLIRVQTFCQFPEGGVEIKERETIFSHNVNHLNFKKHG